MLYFVDKKKMKAFIEIAYDWVKEKQFKCLLAYFQFQIDVFLSMIVIWFVVSNKMLSNRSFFINCYVAQMIEFI